MLPFHKGDRITTAAGGATLTGFSATVKGASADAPEAPRRKGGHQLRAGDVIRLSEWSADEAKQKENQK